MIWIMPWLKESYEKFGKSELEKDGYLDIIKNYNIEVGDIIYIYISTDVCAIKYQTKVIDVEKDFYTIALEKLLDIPYNKLKSFGLKSKLQGGIKLAGNNAQIAEKIAQENKSLIISQDKSPEGYVYIFYDKKDNILYIGKAKNFNSRMKQHFSNGHLPEKCYNQIKTIKYIKLPTYMDAGIVERYLIGKYKPQYNTQMTKEGTPTISVHLNNDDWKTLNIDNLK